MPLLITVNIILYHVYNQKLTKFTLSKKVLKKLILGSCQKIAYIFNNIIYEQKDGVSIEGSLGPVLANLIMTECEKVIVDNLVKEGTMKFYVRYVDDTLLLVKRQDIDKALKRFNGSDKNLEFTVDRFENESMDSSMDSINVDSFTLWKGKTAWIRSLSDQAKKIRSKENLPKELQPIKKFASWNGYPKNIVNAIIKRVLSKETLTNDIIRNEEKDKIQTVFINIDYPEE